MISLSYAKETAFIANPECKDTGVANRDWAMGAWKNSYYKLVFTSKEKSIYWAMERSRHSSQRWGEKSAMKASGIVKTISPCSIELEGRYDWSETQKHIGLPLLFKAKLIDNNRLSGAIYGAAKEWVDMRFRRDVPEEGSKKP